MSQTALVAVLGRAGLALNPAAKLTLVGAFCAVAAVAIGGSATPLKVVRAPA